MPNKFYSLEQAYFIIPNKVKYQTSVKIFKYSISHRKSFAFEAVDPKLIEYTVRTWSKALKAIVVNLNFINFLKL